MKIKKTQENNINKWEKRSINKNRPKNNRDNGIHREESSLKKYHKNAPFVQECKENRNMREKICKF